MVVVLAGTIALLPGARAGAETFKVNTRADHALGACNSSDCTLREAVRAANEADGSDLIKLKGADKPYRLTRSGDEEDQAKKGDLDLGNEPLEIKGASPSRTVIEQTERDRVIDVPGTDAAVVHLARLTITGGRSADGPGGGIHSSGLLFLDRVTLRGNESEFSGGGVSIDNGGSFTDTGQLTMSRSTVKGNTARLGGGGINLNAVGLDTRISGSTVAANRASSGGGIAYSGTGQATVINSTLTANKAILPDIANPLSTGGALSAYGDVTVVSTTITRNRAPAEAVPGEERAASLYANVGDTIALENSIVADRRGDAPHCNGEIESHGHNLGDDPADTCTLEESSDQPDANPGLQGLDANGGPTSTHALAAGSDAIDAAACDPGLIPTVVATDQRGFLRPTTGEECDVGAFERGASPNG
jgi:CSLREA domain-containing protein